MLKDLTHMVQHAGLRHDEMMNMILYEAIKRNRRDRRYAERFPEEKIGGTRDFSQKARGKLGFYSAELGERDYRLVNIKNLGR